MCGSCAERAAFSQVEVDMSGIAIFPHISFLPVLSMVDRQISINIVAREKATEAGS